MTTFSRRGFILSGASSLGLAACGAPQGGGISSSTAPPPELEAELRELYPLAERFNPEGRPIATTRAEPLNAVAARYGIEPLSYEARPDGAHDLPAIGMSLIPAQFHRQVVPYSGPHRPGTIVVNNAARHLFLVLPEGHALRYGISVGREGRTWRGTGTIYRRAAWPVWTPTARMMREDPGLRQYAGGFPGGPKNPLGARALYLQSGGVDRGYRIHGTPEYWLIGRYVSSGCIRMINHDVIDLYGRVPNGARVVTV